LGRQATGWEADFNKEQQVTSTNMGAIKDVLIDEMGGLASYAEHRKIGDAIDRQFVAYARVKTRRLQALFGVLVALGFGSCLLHIEHLRQTGTPQGSLTSLLWLLAFGLLAAAQLSRLSRRQVALRALDALAEATEDATEHDPELPAQQAS
jgi:hypothetical protein